MAVRWIFILFIWQPSPFSACFLAPKRVWGCCWGCCQLDTIRTKRKTCTISSSVRSFSLSSEIVSRMSPIPASSSASKASSSSESSSCPVDRGLLIVFEGCDRSGKTTHCKRITKELGDEAVFMRFPDRSTPMGQMIDGYLKGEKQLNDKVIHLLFAANRWEKVQELEEAIQAGKHVIVDRVRDISVCAQTKEPYVYTFTTLVHIPRSAKLYRQN